MDIWKNYKSPLGYSIGDNGIDSYGVDHNGFTIHDDLAYQDARQERENQLIQNYNDQGIMENYPQSGNEFWGNSAENNYGFGSSDISGNIENILQQLHNSSINHNQTPTPWNTATNQSQISSQSAQSSNVWSEQNRRNIENDLLMNGMDTLYGMNRAANGITFGGLDWLGNKLGYDTQMNEYLNLKDPQSRELAQTAGKVAEYGGNALTGGTIAQAVYPPVNVAYNSYKIGKAYDRLSENPYQGSGRDIIARMKNHDGEPVVLQRGEAIRGPNGEVVVYGKNLRRETGTLRNYGLDKIIHKHEMPRNEVKQIPQYLKQNQPVEVSPRGQNVYAIQQPNGEIRLVTTPKDGENIVSSMYYLNR